MRFKLADDLTLRPREWSILRYLLQFPNGHLFEAFYKRISLWLLNEKYVNWRTWRILYPPLRNNFVFGHFSRSVCILSFFYFTTLWSKHPYRWTVRKLRVNERIYHFFRWLRVNSFDILESVQSFWLAFLHMLFKWDLKFSLLSITIPRIFSSVTFPTVV